MQQVVNVCSAAGGKGYALWVGSLCIAIVPGPDDQLQGRICALHSAKPIALLVVDESGARSAPLGRRARPVNRRQREEGSSPSVRDEILTTEEVCTLLKIKKATLYRHTSQGTGPPFYKIGKHNRWKRSEVMAWFDSHLDELSRSGR